MRLRPLFQLIFTLSLFFAAALLTAPKAAAVVRTWDGGGMLDTNWNTCTNWSSDTCPGSSDIATFDVTSITNTTINTDINVAGIDINTGYTGTITQSSGVTVTVGTSNYDQAAGTFTGGDSAMTITGNYVLSGGTFTATSGTTTLTGNLTHIAGGSFAHNSGTFVYDGNNKIWNFDSGLTGSGSFYNLTVNTTAVNPLTISTGDNLIVNGALNLTDGAVNTGNLQAYGNVTVASTFNGGTATLEFKGSSDQNFDLTGAAALFISDITVNKTSGTVTLLSTLTMSTSGQDLTVSSGTLAVGSNNLTVQGNLTVSGGTLSGGSGTWTLVGNLTISGGSFTASSGTTTLTGSLTHTAGGSFAHNSGTFVYDGNNKTWDFNSGLTGSGSFYNFTLNTSSVNPLTVATGDNLIVNGALNLTDGAVNTGNLQPYGNVTVASTFNGGTATLEFKGSSNQNFDLTGAAALFTADITVNKTSGTVILLSTLTMSASGQDLTISGGTFSLNGNNLTVAGPATEKLIVQTGATLQLQGGETITADSASYPQLDSGSTVEYSGTSGPYTLKDYTYHHLTINGSGGTFNGGSNETLGGNLTVTAGTYDVNDYTLAINGNTTINGGTLKTGTNTIAFGDAAGDSVTISSGGLQIESDAPGTDITVNAGSWTNSGGTITYNAATSISVNLLSNLGSSYYHLTINSSGSTYTLAAALDVNGDLTLTAGNLDVSGSNYGVSVAGGWTDTGSGTFVERSGTVTFDGTGAINANEAFNNVTINTAGTAALGAALDVNGDLTLTAGSLNISGSNYGISVAGSWTDTGAGSFAERSGTVTFDGTGTINANEAFNNVTINTSGTTTLGAALDVNGSLAINGGTLDASASDYGISVAGGWTDTGAGIFVERSGTVTFDGSGVVNANEAFNNVTINTSGTTTLGAALDVNGNLSITSGTLDVSASNYGISVAGNWAKSGTFTARSGTVSFDDASQTSTISGSTSFYDLSCTTSSKALTFTAATTQTVEGTMTLTGASGSLIVLRSSSSGSEWFLTINGTSAVDYVDVKDSNASGGDAIIHAVDPSRSTDSGNNTNWSFNGEPTVASVSAVQTTAGDGDVTITFIIDDPDDDDTVQAKIEYSINGGSSWGDPTLSTTDSETTASVAGDPSINNAVTYQVGQSGAYILTSSGANTISIVWEAATDVAASTDVSNARIRVTPYDGTAAGTAGTSSDFNLDLVDPSGLANLNYTDFSVVHLVLTWTAASDTNFDHYEIWYGSSESDVQNRTGTAQEWDDSDDSALATASTTTTRLTSVDPRNSYI